MNKIILDKSNIIELVIKENSIIDISKYYEINILNIKVLNNVSLIINHYSEIDNKFDLKINIVENNNSEFIYNHSFMNNNNYNLNISVEMIGNNSKNNINIKGISNGGHTNIVIDGIVCENTIDNELDESIRVLNINDGKSNILPNMYINTKNVLANHACTITNIDNDYLFYLNSKGINNELGKNLIIDGFLENNAR